MERNLTQRILIVKLVVFDVDGVLTDGRIYKSDTGEEMLAFDVRDGMGIARLKEEGIDVAIITGRSSGAVRTRSKELGIDKMVMGKKNKGEAIENMAREYGFQMDSIAFVGDDILDISAMKKVGLAVAVADAVEEVKKVAHLVLEKPGGRGAAREFAEIILKAKGVWDKG